MRLDKLTTMEVQALVRGLSERGLSARTVRYAMAIFGGALRFAIKHRLIGWNPAEDVELPGEHRGELKCPPRRPAPVCSPSCRLTRSGRSGA